MSCNHNCLNIYQVKLCQTISICDAKEQYQSILKRLNMHIRKSTDLDSVGTYEVESHALDQNLEEEPGILQELTDHHIVSIGRP